MEVSVVAAQNPPAMPVLAIHTGSVRRQARMEVNRPFLMPHSGSQNCAVEVALFHQLASQTLPDDGKPEATCSIPVRKPDGVASQVQLLVRRGVGETVASSGTAPGFEAQQPFHNSEVVLPIEATKPPLAAKDYLDHHHLQKRIQQLIQDVLREQPDNPYRYMLKQLRLSRSGQESSEQPAPEAAAPLPAEARGLPGCELAEEAVKASGPALAAAPAGSAAQPMQPRAPESAAPPRGARRPAPHSQGGEDKKAAVADEVTTQQERVLRKEAHELSHAVIRGILHSPVCLKVAEEFVRESCRKDASRVLVGSILRHVVAQAASCPREQARTILASAYGSASWRFCDNYRHAVTRRTLTLSYKRASNLETKPSGHDAKDNGSAPLRHRHSLPTPIVALTGEANWATWLSNK